MPQSERVCEAGYSVILKNSAISAGQLQDLLKYAMETCLIHHVDAAQPIGVEVQAMYAMPSGMHALGIARPMVKAAGA